MMKCQECGKEGAENYKPQLDKIICNECFDKDYYFDPFSKTKTGRKYISICNELDKIEMYIHHVLANPELYSDVIVLKNVVSMLQFMRKSLYKPMYHGTALPSVKALVNVEIADMLIKKRKTKIIFECEYCGIQFKKVAYDKGKPPRFCSQKCYRMSLHKVINVSLLDKTAEVLAKIKDEDLELLETLRGSPTQT